MKIKRAEKVTNMRSVLIVDDHPLYSEALALALERLINLKRIEIAETMEEAISLIAKRFLPNIIFLDLKLPDARGMSGFLHLKKRLKNVPIVVISATSKSDIIQIAYDEGAEGYIVKNLSHAELERAVQTILEGGRYFPKGFFSSNQTDRKTHPDDLELYEISEKLSYLTSQQTKILLLICEGKLNKQIAYELDLAEATVKTHITSMMRKLNVQNRTQAALLVQNAMNIADLQ